MSFKRRLFSYLINSFGWKTSEKIIVFESDDWGAVRMPSKNTFDMLKTSEIKVDDCPYSKFDSLETPNDLQALFDILLLFKDRSGNSPKFTFNFVVANPDYERIRESGFEMYYYETADKTYRKFGHETMQLIDFGISNNLIQPQFHGREHLNVEMWLDLLHKNANVRFAADNGLYMLSFANLKSLKIPYLASYYPYGENYTIRHQEIFNDGVRIFKLIFNQKPTSFVAPVYIWHDCIEELLPQMGINSTQGLFRKISFTRDNSLKFEYRNFKRVSKTGTLNIIRNCFFEPSTNSRYDWVSNVMQEIKTAFMLRRPAIICTHRLNYIGSINESNRAQNLNLLKELLAKILRTWPDVRFMSSDQLCEYLS